MPKINFNTDCTPCDLTPECPEFTTPTKPILFKVNLVFQGEGSGIVYVNLNTFNNKYTSDTSFEFPINSKIRFDTVPDISSTFRSWTGDIITLSTDIDPNDPDLLSEPLTLSLCYVFLKKEEMTAIVTFSIKKIRLLICVNPINSGTITNSQYNINCGSGGSCSSYTISSGETLCQLIDNGVYDCCCKYIYDYDTLLNIKAIPESLYKLSEWCYDGISDIEKNNPLLSISLKKSLVVFANFRLKLTYTLDIEILPDVTIGTIFNTSNNIDCGQTCSYTFSEDSIIKLFTKILNTDYEFEKWEIITGKVQPTSSSAIVTMTENCSVKAIFKKLDPIEVNLQISSKFLSNLVLFEFNFSNIKSTPDLIKYSAPRSSAAVKIDSGVTLQLECECTNTDYDFMCWKTPSDVISSNTSFSYTTLRSDQILYCYFLRIGVTLYSYKIVGAFNFWFNEGIISTDNSLIQLNPPNTSLSFVKYKGSLTVTASTSNSEYEFYNFAVSLSDKRIIYDSNPITINIIAETLIVASFKKII